MGRDAAKMETRFVEGLSFPREMKAKPFDQSPSAPLRRTHPVGIMLPGTAA
jgi:hypothetical protein